MVVEVVEGDVVAVLLPPVELGEAPPSAPGVSVPPPVVGPPVVGPPVVGPPSVGPPSVGPPSVGPPSFGPPSSGPPSIGSAGGSTPSHVAWFSRLDWLAGAYAALFWPTTPSCVASAASTVATPPRAWCTQPSTTLRSLAVVVTVASLLWPTLGLLARL